jgi:2-haloacid dehalogenase
METFIGRRKFIALASATGASLLGGFAHASKGDRGNPVKNGPDVLTTARRRSDAKNQPTLVFDVNETLLDLNALRPHFERVFGDGRALEQWFSLLLQYSLVVNAADAYADFGTLGRAVLEMLAESRRVKLSSEDKNAILKGVLSLTPHPEVANSLKRLRSAGFRMATLTNSTALVVEAQLQKSGLAQYFDESISVDSVRRFKPDLETYRYAAGHLGAEPGELWLIAAHAWDVLGAKQAGWKAAFVARNGRPLLPLGPKPDLIAPDIA